MQKLVKKLEHEKNNADKLHLDLSGKIQEINK